MAALLPILAMAIPGLLGAVSGGINIASAVKQLRGGRLMMARRPGRIHRGKGLSPMYIQRPYAGSGLLFPAGRGLSPMYIQRPYAGAGLRRKKKRGGGKRKMAKRRGKGLSPMYIQRPYAGCGLLAPAGRGLSPMYIQRPYAGAGLRRHRGGRVQILGRYPLVRGTGMLTPPGGHNQPYLKKNTGLSTSFINPYIVTKYEGGPFRAPKGEHYEKTPIPKTIIERSLEKGLGLLSPAGGYIRRGYYRKGPHGKRVHVPSTVVRGGGRLVKRKAHNRRGKGGRLIRVKASRVRRRGRGVVADTLGSIPLLGSLLGPIARALGGKIRHRGGRHGNQHRMSDTIKAILRGGSIQARANGANYFTGMGAKRRRGGYLPNTWRTRVNGLLNNYNSGYPIINYR